MISYIFLLFNHLKQNEMDYGYHLMLNGIILQTIYYVLCYIKFKKKVVVQEEQKQEEKKEVVEEVKEEKPETKEEVLVDQEII
jgi:phosphotransferase system  glucose/maltose/N-acetylglucosamine-specific IIC component